MGKELCGWGGLSHIRYRQFSMQYAMPTLIMGRGIVRILSNLPGRVRVCEVCPSNNTGTL